MAEASADDSHARSRRALLLDAWPGAEPLAGSGLGSSLFKLAAAADAQRAGWRLDLWTSAAKAELLQGTPALGELAAGDAPAPLSAALSRYDRILPLGIRVPLSPELAAAPGFVPFSAADRDEYRRRPHLEFWRAFLAARLGYARPLAPARFPLAIRPEEKTAAARRLEPTARWLGLAASALSPLKQYRRWPEVIEGLLAARADLAIVILGAERWPFAPRPRVLDLSGRTGLRELLALVARCELILGSDGLVNNLALILGRPALTLFGIIDPRWVIDPDQERRSRSAPLLHPGCPLQFCYSTLENYRSSPCPLEPQLPREEAVRCMRHEPQAIVAAALALLPSVPRAARAT